MAKTQTRRLTVDEWRAEAQERFGADEMQWRFKCPSCGYVAAIADWKAAGAHSGSAAFACIGRWTGATQEMLEPGPGPCNYSGGGLIAGNHCRCWSKLCYLGSENTCSTTKVNNAHTLLTRNSV